MEAALEPCLLTSVVVFAAHSPQTPLSVSDWAASAATGNGPCPSVHLARLRDWREDWHSYLSSSTLSTDHNGLVDWLDKALDISIGLFTHCEDVGFQFLEYQSHMSTGLRVSDSMTA